MIFINTEYNIIEKLENKNKNQLEIIINKILANIIIFAKKHPNE